MASQEITDAGVANLGLQDRELGLYNLRKLLSHCFVEREAYRWIQKYIGAFGGDHSKVTMYALRPITSQDF